MSLLVVVLFSFFEGCAGASNTRYTVSELGAKHVNGTIKKLVVSGDNVVWMEEQHDYSIETHLFNVQTGSVSIISYPEGLGYGSPDSKIRVIIDNRPTSRLWKEGRAGDIIVYNPENKDTVKLHIWAYPFGFAASGDLVVWTQGSFRGPSEVYGYDLTARKKFHIATGIAYNISIDANTVAWKEPIGYDKVEGYVHAVRINREPAK